MKLTTRHALSKSQIWTKISFKNHFEITLLVLKSGRHLGHPTDKIVFFFHSPIFSILFPYLRNIKITKVVREPTNKTRETIRSAFSSSQFVGIDFEVNVWRSANLQKWEKYALNKKKINKHTSSPLLNFLHWKMSENLII